MFAKYLVPTDFSVESEYSLRYAAALSRQHGGRMVLFHACKTGLFSLGKSKEKEQVAYEKLEKLKAQIQSELGSGSPDMETRVVHGRVADEIIRYAGKNKVSFIVMGFKGEGQSKNSMVGRNTLELILRSPVPVISVPENCHYRPIHKIVYTNHNARTENTNFNTIVKLAENYEAEVVILRPRSKKQEDPDSARSVFSHKRNIFKYQNIHKFYSETDDLAEAMSLYIRDHQPDIMSLGINDEQFFERMVRQVYGREVAPNFSIPLLSTSL